MRNERITQQIGLAALVAVIGLGAAGVADGLDKQPTGVSELDAAMVVNELVMAAKAHDAAGVCGRSTEPVACVNELSAAISTVGWPTAVPKIVASRPIVAEDGLAGRAVHMEWRDAKGNAKAADMKILRKNGRFIVAGPVFWVSIART